MARNPKKPVITELVDANAVLALFEDECELPGEELCTDCQGQGTIDHDGTGDEDECHVCRGAGWLTYVP